MSRIVAYLRVSGDEQAESGLGIEAQERTCNDWAVRNGRNVDSIFRDEGLSGSLALEERPGLLDAVSAINKGDILLVAKRDRLFRGDPVAVAMVESAVMKQGGRVISAAGEGTGDDAPTSILFRRMIDAFGEYERLLIAARTRAALREKKARGERAGAIPYGLRIDPASPVRSRKSGLPAGLVTDQVEAQAIEFVKRWHAEGLSFRAIAKRLDAEGIPTKGGQPWRQSTVHSLLRRLEREAASQPG